MRVPTRLSTFHPMLHLRIRASLLLLAALLSACASEPNASQSVFVGSTSDGDVLVASVWEEDRVIVYSCGVGDTLDTDTAWLVTTPVNRSIEATEGSFSVVATREANMVRGTFESQTGTGALDLRAVTSLEDAGFFVTNEGSCRTAAVAFRRDGVMLVQGAHFCDAEGPFSQVTPVLPPELLGNSLLVQFDTGSGLRQLALERVNGI